MTNIAHHLNLHLKITYKIGGSTVDFENSTIPTYVEVQTLKQIIGAKLEFNYKEQKLNIVVK